MSRAWCEKNNATGPVDVRKGKENTATLKANGTGPFMLRHEPGVRTELAMNPELGQDRAQRHRSHIHAHRNDATRVAALASGEIDMMQPVPVQDIARLSTNPALRVLQGLSCARFSSASTSRATS